MRYEEELRYGFRLYPFAVTIMLGVFLSGTGPALLRSFTAGISGVTGYNLVLLTGILGLQLLGGVFAAAGFFGGLKKVITDSKASAGSSTT